MGIDDANEGIADGECPGHQWIPEEFHLVQPEGVSIPGMAITNKCALCGAIFYEPSNYDKFPETKGIDPRL